MHSHVIPNVLDSAEIARVHALIQRSRFVPGSESAEGAAEQVKSNEQLQCAPGDARMLGELVFQALGRSREFHRQALPLEISVPMINRYGVGMSYGAHFDRAFIVGASGRQIRTDLSDYRTVNGLTMPFTMKQSINGKPVAEVSISTWEVNVPIDDGIFRMPAAKQ